MKILAHVHKYPPVHNAGAEHMLHTILRYMLGDGHEVHVRTISDPATNYEGVQVERFRSTRAYRDYQWADIVVTHLDLTRKVVAFAQRHDKPLVHLVHNDSQLRFFDVDPSTTDLAVMNSQWLLHAYKWWKGPKTVCIPPVFWADYQSEDLPTREYVTLINLFAPKGTDVFWPLARRMPDTKFLAVRGAYGHQDIPRDVPDNVTIVDNTPDIRTVYTKTRILLMPSTYESWGRCAIEAAATGIPTIASPTPGLRESLGRSGYFCRTRNPAEWQRAIEIVDQKYPDYSRRAQKRSRELDDVAADQLVALTERFVSIVEQRKLVSA